MAKRFIDTGFFKSPFVRGLEAPLKTLYSYIICDCDGAGIWIKDLEVASIYIGAKVGETEFANAFVKTGKCIDLNDGRFFFPDFLKHQYTNGLSATNPAHKNFILALKSYNLLDENLQIIQRPFKDPSKTLQRGLGIGIGKGNSIGKGIGIGKKKEKPEIIFPYESEGFKDLWKQWKEYKRLEFKFRYKSPQSEQAALTSLAKLATSENEAKEIILQSIANGWKGFHQLKTNFKNGSKNDSIDKNKRAAVDAILDSFANANPK